MCINLYRLYFLVLPARHKELLQIVFNKIYLNYVTHPPYTFGAGAGSPGANALLFQQ